MTAITISERTAAIAEGWIERPALELIREHIAPDLTDGEFALYLSDAKARGLDPMRKQIYAVKRKGKVAHQVGIDGFWTIAHRTGECAGEDPPQWCGPDGTWRDVWLQDEPPAAARVAVYRMQSGVRVPYHAVVRWADFVPMEPEYRNGRPTGRRVVAMMWQKMGAHMLAKVATAQALRKAFPEDLSGLYTGEEMAQAGNDVVEGTVVDEAPKPRGLDDVRPKRRPAPAPRRPEKPEEEEEYSGPLPPLEGDDDEDIDFGPPPPQKQRKARGPQWVDEMGVAGGAGEVYDDLSMLEDAYRAIPQKLRSVMMGKHKGKELLDAKGRFIEWYRGVREEDVADPTNQYRELAQKQLAVLDLVDAIHEARALDEGEGA